MSRRNSLQNIDDSLLRADFGEDLRDISPTRLQEVLTQQRGAIPLPGMVPNLIRSSQSSLHNSPLHMSPIHQGYVNPMMAASAGAIHHMSPMMMRHEYEAQLAGGMRPGKFCDVFFFNAKQCYYPL